MDKIISSTFSCFLSQAYTHPTSNRFTLIQPLIVAHSPNLSQGHTHPTSHRHTITQLEPQAVKPKSRSSGSFWQFVKLPFLLSRMPIKQNPGERSLQSEASDQHHHTPRDQILNYTIWTLFAESVSILQIYYSDSLHTNSNQSAITARQLSKPPNQRAPMPINQPSVRTNSPNLSISMRQCQSIIHRCAPTHQTSQSACANANQSSFGAC